MARLSAVLSWSTDGARVSPDVVLDCMYQLAIVPTVSLKLASGHRFWYWLSRSRGKTSLCLLRKSLNLHGASSLRGLRHVKEA
jgi:hypothetical protein